VKPDRFTVLVGSRARGTADQYSDIDIVRVGHKRPVSKRELACFTDSQKHISYIDYDLETFISLHASGSLFVHHILTEGKLLAGDPNKWSDLIESFRVAGDLRHELKEQLRLYRWLARIDKSEQATMPLLSHMFRALKNAAIFSLAQHGIYIYDKRTALRRAFPSLTKSDIELLVTANNAFVRGAPRLTKSDRAAAAAALPELVQKLSSISGELLSNGQKTSPQRH
jgi:predicted nucleotidyltransferase